MLLASHCPILCRQAGRGGHILRQQAACFRQQTFEQASASNERISPAMAMRCWRLHLCLFCADNQQGGWTKSCMFHPSIVPIYFRDITRNLHCRPHGSIYCWRLYRCLFCADNQQGGLTESCMCKPYIRPGSFKKIMHIAICSRDVFIHRWPFDCCLFSAASQQERGGGGGGGASLHQTISLSLSE